MNKKQNHNSITFLTTLSVYLGLVLVGGTAPVLAHSALTRNFDINNEIVFEEDLDKKPDDDLAQNVEKCENLKIAEALVNFLANLKEQEKRGNFDPIRDRCLFYRTESEEFESRNITNIEADIEADWLKEIIGNLISTAQTKDVQSISGWTANSENRNSRKSSVEIKSDYNEFSLTFAFNKKSSKTAKIAAKCFQDIFVDKKVRAQSLTETVIYENTVSFSENNQVFIVTRLPRASIDALLTEKDA